MLKQLASCRDGQWLSLGVYHVVLKVVYLLGVRMDAQLGLVTVRPVLQVLCASSRYIHGACDALPGHASD